MSFDIGMSKNSIVISCLMLFLAACGGDGNSSVSANDEPVSEESSSSSKKLSSSSVILSANEESCSSLAKSSSSSKVTDKVGEPAEPAEETSSSCEKAKSSSSKDEKETKESSSSVKSESSSSDENSQLSSSSSTDVRSSSSEPESSSSSVSELSSSSLNDFDWNLPKEAYLNPDIDYGTVTDERDGKVYKTVTIGDQVWMAENLNYADSSKTPSLKGKNWCYGDELKNCDVAGRLYTWAAAIDSVKLANDVDNPQDCGYGKTCTLPATVQGVCPEGWHLPSQMEWNTLFTAVGGQSTAGKVLKSQTGWHKNNGTDAFGFAVLPTGLGAPKGTFDYVGWLAYFWSSTESDSSRACSVSMDYYYADAGLGNITKYFGYSVRCVKD